MTQRDSSAPGETERQLSVAVVERLDGIGTTAWNELWGRSESPSVFARYEWIEAWWETQSDGRSLRVYTAHDGDRFCGLLATIWPKDRGEVSLVGEEHADYAAILTCGQPDQVFTSLLAAICDDLQPGQRLVLSDVRDDTSYSRGLSALSKGVWSRWRKSTPVMCPRTTLDAAIVDEILRKKSLKRKVNKLARLGTVTVNHLEDASDILPKLDAFFEQHVERWKDSGTPSLFLNSANKDFYRRIVENFNGTGLLIYTEILLDEDPVACHIGFCSERDFIWYKPTYATNLSHVSPGEVLLRELFAESGRREFSGFDFTRGDEAFKLRFANTRRYVHTYTRYPSRVTAVTKKLSDSVKAAIRDRMPAAMLNRLRRLRSRIRSNR